MLEVHTTMFPGVLLVQHSRPDASTFDCCGVQGFTNLPDSMGRALARWLQCSALFVPHAPLVCVGWLVLVFCSRPPDFDFAPWCLANRFSLLCLACAHG